jgi:hypothetical protein
LGNGYTWRIYSIASQNSSTCTCVIEDVDGFNARIDPSGGIDGGGPGSNIGYVYELNANGLPVLHETPNPPSVVWTDAQLARFLYMQTAPSPSGTSKSFTFYLAYSDSNTISEINIPAGLFSSDSYGTLAIGGTFVANQGSDLVFVGTAPGTIQMNNLTNAVVSNMNALGYISTGEWRQVPSSSMGGTKMRVSYNTANSIVINNLTLEFLNGGNLGITSTYPYAGYLAEITLTFV